MKINSLSNLAPTDSAGEAFQFLEPVRNHSQLLRISGNIDIRALKKHLRSLKAQFISDVNFGNHPIVSEAKEQFFSILGPS